MMGFFDKVKNVFGSKKEEESQNSVNDEVIDEPTFTESIENDDENFNDNEEIKSEDSEETPANEEIIDKPTPNEKIRNFKYLDDLIHSGSKEIILDSDIVLGFDEESKYLEGIRLDVYDLVIDGNGFTVDARGKTRIFYCTGKNILIKNITLKNGFAERNGGAIHNSEGELTITESVLTQNTAQEGGGAISNQGTTMIHPVLGKLMSGEITITNSIFSNNKVQAKYSGGAINNKGGRLNISKSTFTNTSGVVIFNFYKGMFDSTKPLFNENVKCNITESIFSENNDGIINNVLCKSDIAESMFSNNSGKLIENLEGECIIAESTFSENILQQDSIIHNIKGNFKIFGCEISGNASPDSIILNKDSLEIHNTNFSDNKSKYIILNEGFELHGILSNLSIFYGEFIENNVEETVVCNSGKFCSIEKTVFKNNISDNAMNIINENELTLKSPEIKDEGKTILNKKYVLIRNSPSDLENKICGDGTVENIENMMPQGENFDFTYLNDIIRRRKCILYMDKAFIRLNENICIENYERDYLEGGIELDIDNLIIDGNGKTISGADKSRIFIITGENITLKNLIFKNGCSHKNYDNIQNSNGGAIKINRNTKVTIENCEFMNNLSEEGGGALYNRGMCYINDSIFAENISKIFHLGGGGAIYNNDGKLNIVKSAFAENIAPYGSGGAIYNSDGELSITESTLNNNTSEFGGGAIYNSDGELSITESTLQENTVQEKSSYGGAISNYEEKSFNIKNCKLESNKPDDLS